MSPCFTSSAFGQPEVLLRRHVAEHRGAGRAGDRRADRGRDVVVAGRDVGDERPEHVERRLVAHLHLPSRRSSRSGRSARGPGPRPSPARPLPGAARELAQRVELGELRARRDASARQPGRSPSPSEIVTSCARQISSTRRSARRAGSASVVVDHPLRHERAAAADDAGDAARRRAAGARAGRRSGASCSRRPARAWCSITSRRPSAVRSSTPLDLLRAPGRSGRCRSAPGSRRGSPRGSRRCRRRSRGPSPCRRRASSEIAELLELAVDVGGDGGVADVRVDLAGEAMPIAIGSSAAWWTFAGMIIRPRATSARTSSGSSRSRSATYAISCVIAPRRAWRIWVSPAWRERRGDASRRPERGSMRDGCSIVDMEFPFRGVARCKRTEASNRRRAGQLPRHGLPRHRCRRPQSSGASPSPMVSFFHGTWHST